MEPCSAWGWYRAEIEVTHWDEGDVGSQLTSDSHLDGTPFKSEQISHPPWVSPGHRILSSCPSLII